MNAFNSLKQYNQIIYLFLYFQTQALLEVLVPKLNATLLMVFTSLSLHNRPPFCGFLRIKNMSAISNCLTQSFQAHRSKRGQLCKQPVSLPRLCSCARLCSRCISLQHDKYLNMNLRNIYLLHYSRSEVVQPHPWSQFSIEISTTLATKRLNAC